MNKNFEKGIWADFVFFGTDLMTALLKEVYTLKFYVPGVQGRKCSNWDIIFEFFFNDATTKAKFLSL